MYLSEKKTQNNTKRYTLHSQIALMSFLKAGTD